MAGREQRIEPLQRKDARSGRHSAGLHGHRLDPPPQYGHHGRRAVRNTGRVSHLLDARQYSAETRRLERQDLTVALEPQHGLLHERIGDRAHVTQLLRQDQLRIESLEEALVEQIEAASLVQRGGDVPVDIPAVAHLVAQDGPGHDRKSPRRGGKVTFVRHADQPVVEAEREDDLGRAREQRADLTSHLWRHVVRASAHARTKLVAMRGFEPKCRCT